MKMDFHDADFWKKLDIFSRNVRPTSTCIIIIIIIEVLLFW